LVRIGSWKGIEIYTPKRFPNNVMQALLITEVFPPKHGGSGRWFWELYRRLPRGAVHVVAHQWPGANEFDQAHNLPITRLPLRFENWGVMNPRGLKKYIRQAHAIRAIARETRPRVLHCARCVPEGFLAWLLRQMGGPPYWLYVHGEELTYAKASRELGWLARRSFRGADHVIANSRNTRKMLLADWHVPADRITVLYPGVDANAFVPAERDPAIRAQLGWGNRPVILTVGALSARKGQDMMIRALPAIRRAVPDILYAIAGEGWERPRLEQLAAENGVADTVQFRGTPTDRELVECYQQCDVFALPNRQAGNDVEGFGIVLLEAQACGKPVLAGASGGTAETMNIPETGTVVDCTSSEQLAEVMVEWLKDSARREQMGRNARNWIVERFDWSVLVRQASQLFGLNGTSANLISPDSVCGHRS
jgi:phosphatidylinositol alpha-1,6-mannosyltransferase